MHPVVQRQDGTVAVLKGHPSSKKFVQQLGEALAGLGGGCDIDGVPVIPKPQKPKAVINDTKAYTGSIPEGFKPIHTFEKPPSREWLAEFGRRMNEAGIPCRDEHGVELATYAPAPQEEKKPAEPAKRDKAVGVDEMKPPVHVVYCHTWRTDGRQDQDDDLLLTSISSLCNSCHNPNLFVYVLLEGWTTLGEKALFDNFVARFTAMRDGWIRRWYDRNGCKCYFQITYSTIPGCIQAEYDQLQKHPDDAAVPRLKNVIYARWFAPELLRADIDENNASVGYNPYVQGEDCGPHLVYLDIDTVVQQDLTPYFMRDYVDGAIAATQDHYLVWQKRRDAGYVHSAMFVFDVKRWCDQKCCQACVDCAKKEMAEGREAVFTDQDYVNLALKGRIDILPPRALAMANVSFYQGGLFTPQDYVETSGMSVADASSMTWDDIYRQSVVLHFAGKNKPPEWHENLAYRIWRREYDAMLEASGVPKFGILIPSKGDECLKGAVQSAENLIQPGLEGEVVIAVSIDSDTGKVPKQVVEVASWVKQQPNVVFLSSHKRTGHGPGSNRNFLMDAMRRKCRYFVWLDDDDRFCDQSWLLRLSDEIDARSCRWPFSDVLCVGGQYVYGENVYSKLPPKSGSFSQAFDAGCFRQGAENDPGPFIFFEPWPYIVRSCVRFKFAEDLPEDVYGLMRMLDEIHDDPAFLQITPYIHFIKNGNSVSSSAIGRLANASVPYRLAAYYAAPKSDLGVKAVRAAMRYFLTFTQNTGVGLAGEDNPNEENQTKEQDNGSK